MLRYPPRRQRPGDLRHRAAQLGGLRLAAGDRRAVRHRQRPRPARRRLPALRAESHRRRAASTAGPSPTAINVPDPDFGAGHEDRIAASMPPVHGFRAHNAPLGIVFLRSPPPGDAYRGRRARRPARLVEPHAARTATRSCACTGARTGRSRSAISSTGFERDDDVIGRPVDVAEGADGAIYVSDDYAGVDLSRDASARARASARAPAAPAAPARRIRSPRSSADERAGSRAERPLALGAARAARAVTKPRRRARRGGGAAPGSRRAPFDRVARRSCWRRRRRRCRSSRWRARSAARSPSTCSIRGVESREDGGAGAAGGLRGVVLVAPRPPGHRAPDPPALRAAARAHPRRRLRHRRDHARRCAASAA